MHHDLALKLLLLVPLSALLPLYPPVISVKLSHHLYLIFFSLALIKCDFDGPTYFTSSELHLKGNVNVSMNLLKAYRNCYAHILVF